MPRKKIEDVLEPVAQVVEESIQKKGGYVALEDFEQNWSYEAVLPNGKTEIKRSSVSVKAGQEFKVPDGWLHDKAYEQATRLKSQRARGCIFLLPLGSHAHLPVKEV